MTRLEKVQIWSNIASPFVIAALGIWIQRTVASEDTNVRYIEAAMQVLREPATPENKPLRSWAVDVLSKHSPVHMDKALLDALRAGAVLVPSKEKTLFAIDPEAGSIAPE